MCGTFRISAFGFDLPLAVNPISSNLFQPILTVDWRLWAERRPPGPARSDLGSWTLDILWNTCRAVAWRRRMDAWDFELQNAVTKLNSIKVN